ncbi:MAG TPA: hypothetical protein VK841_05390, partial [Polyangiaceae bacterium]|nr:hypothetical protein [Polyangiaceae bacterium]
MMWIRHRMGLALLALSACSSVPSNSAQNNPSTSGGSGGNATGSGATGNSGSATGSSGSKGSSGGSANSGGSASSGGAGSSGGATRSSGSTGSGGTGNSGSAGGASGTPRDGGPGAADGGFAGGDTGIVEDGEYLYTHETFGGNGRTCVTCHTSATGTISSAQIQALYSANPNDPMFQTIDSDDGVGNSYTQLQQRATIRVTINLPTGVHLVSDPSATSVTFRRGIPSTVNTPALDPNLMWDGREPDLPSQALSAILGHAQGSVMPTTTQLGLIAGYEKTFFSSALLEQYYTSGLDAGAAPTWPAGTTDSEQRGRRWFAYDSAAPTFNVCGQCHGGPMTNETQSNSGLPVGAHFQTVNVSEFNTANNPTYEFSFPDPKNPGQ